MTWCFSTSVSEGWLFVFVSVLSRSPCWINYLGRSAESQASSPVMPGNAY